MADCMSKESYIERIKDCQNILTEIYESKVLGDGTHQTWACGITACQLLKDLLMQLDELEELAALKERTRWIPVNERLPDKPKRLSSVTYNVIIENGKVMSLDWTNAMVRGKEVCRWEWHGRIADWTVTHWMPLPSAADSEAANGN